jgi:hypothetical protein
MTSFGWNERSPSLSPTKAYKATHCSFFGRVVDLKVPLNPGVEAEGCGVIGGFLVTGIDGAGLEGTRVGGGFPTEGKADFVRVADV